MVTHFETANQNQEINFIRINKSYNAEEKTKKTSVEDVEKLEL